MKKLILTTTIAAFALSSKAAFTLSVVIGALYSSGTTDASFQVSGAGGSIGVLVVDTTDQGEANFPKGAALAGKGFAQGADWGNGYRVMSIMTGINNGTQATDASGGNATFFFGTTTSVDLTSASFGSGVDLTRDDTAHQFALYWFPAITDNNAATATATFAAVVPTRNIQTGDQFGFYTNTTNPNSSISGNKTFFTPAGGTGNLITTQARTEDLLSDTVDTGTVQAGLNLANSTFIPNLVVPEPSTYAAFAGLLAFVCAVRRKRNA